MFMDDINNRYTYLNSLKNVIWEEPKDRVHYPDRDIELHPEVEPLLNKLFKERPTWRYKSTQRAYGGGEMRVTRFTIYDGDEDLGEVWMDTHWNTKEVRFYFTNFRLERNRQRTSYTTKPDVALKRIVKAFHMRTPKERAADAVSSVREIASHLLSEASWPVRRAKTVIEKALVEYAVNHWDEVQPMLGPDAKVIDLPGLAQAEREARFIADAVSKGVGVCLRIEPNGTYSASRPVGDTYDVEIYSEATLPDHIRGALGLLKLMEDKNSIEGVGLRVNRNLYFILDKKVGA